MTLTNEDLEAISDLLDEKLDQKLDEKLDQKLDEKLAPINGRLDKMDGRLKVLEAKQDKMAKKLDDLELDMKVAVRDIRKDIHTLNDEMGAVLEVLRVHELMPR